MIKTLKTTTAQEAIIAEYLLGETSYRQLGIKHGIDFRLIHYWVTKFKGKPVRKQKPKKENLQKQATEPLPTDIKLLQDELRKSKLHVELLNTMIDIAEDQLKISIKKKVWHQAVETVEQRSPRCINVRCLLLGYSRQSYYQGVKFIQQKAYESELIIAEVLRHRQHQKRLGTRKLLHEMQDFLSAHRFQIGRDALFTLLAERGLLVTKRKRKGCITTLSRHRYKKYPNLIQGFMPLAPNQLWVSDITYIHVAEEFAYLSLITEVYSHKIVGFYLSKNLAAQGPLKALKMALAANPNRSNLVHHSDRGVQYCCDGYVKLLKDAEIKISMTEKSDPRENAVAERVNGILKTELLEEVFADFSSAQQAVAVACSTYNHLRPHGSIENLKPAEAHLKTGVLNKTWKNYCQINQQKRR